MSKFKDLKKHQLTQKQMQAVNGGHCDVSTGGSLGEFAHDVGHCVGYAVGSAFNWIADQF